MLDEEAVLDALGASSRVPLTAKRTVACVNRATSRVIGRHLRSDDLWVHPEDCTVSAATWLAQLAECNRNLRIHVHDGDDVWCVVEDAEKPVGHVGELCAIAMEQPETPEGAEATTAVSPSTDGWHTAPDDSKLAPVINQVVAFFLGHILVSLPSDDVGICATNGMRLNLSELVKAPHLHRHLCHSRTHPHTLQQTDWCFLAGALYHNALRTARQIPPRGYGGIKFMHFRRTRLTDDAMLHIGAELRTHSVSQFVEGMAFCFNLFGELGTAAIFAACSRPLCGLQSGLFKYEALTSLRFEHTPMGKHGVPHLVNAIAKGCTPKLRLLSLIYVGMEDKSAFQLFALLGTPLLCNLESLSVSFNPFSGFAFMPLTLDAWASPSLVTLRAMGLTRVVAKDYAVLARAIVAGRLRKLQNCPLSSPRGHCVQVALNAQKVTNDANRLIAEAEAPPLSPKSKARKLRKTATSASASTGSHHNSSDASAALEEALASDGDSTSGADHEP
jgi:hypothetical protein